MGMTYEKKEKKLSIIIGLSKLMSYKSYHFIVDIREEKCRSHEFGIC